MIDHNANQFMGANEQSDYDQYIEGEDEYEDDPNVDFALNIQEDENEV
jgi:hypothetical protein